MPKEMPFDAKTGIPSPSTHTHFGKNVANLAWQAANLGTIMATVCVSVTLVQSPINTIVACLMRYGSILPPRSDTSVGSLALVRTLYSGLGSHLLGSTVRAAYVTGVKNNDQETMATSPSNECENTLKQMRTIAGVALGEVCLTQYHETKSALIKSKIITDAFDCKTPQNLIKLSTTGLSARYGTAIINFTALCLGEGFYADFMPFRDPTVNHFLAGALSGVTAAVFSEPLAYYRDKALQKTTVVDGTLCVPKAKHLLENAVEHLKKVGMTPISKEIAAHMFLRMTRIGVTFALVDGIGTWLGKEPLAYLQDKPKKIGDQTPRQSLGFFSHKIPNQDCANIKHQSSYPKEAKPEKATCGSAP